MEEKNGIATAINALGMRIAELEEELRFAKMTSEMYEGNAKRSEEECEQLKKKLRSVETYIDNATRSKEE